MEKSLTSTRAKIKITDLFLVFFPTCFVYLLTLYPTVGTEDSGELITSAAVLDIAHPPGYPLYTLLGKLFTILIPFGNIAWRVNLLSAFFGAATVALLYLTVKKLSKNDLIALSVSLFFAFTDIFWSQSIRAETYTLSAFFLILIIYLLVCWDSSQKNGLLYAAAFAYGLSLTNQHTMFLAGPPILIYILARNWRVILKPKIVVISLSLFLLGLSVYLYLPLRSAWGPYDNPAYIKHEALYTFENFFNFVNRKIYGGTVNTTLGSSGLEGFIPMLKRVFAEFFYVPILLFIPGIWLLLKKYRKISVLIIGLFIFYTAVQLVFIRISLDMHPFNAFTSRPFLISSTLILAIIISCGVSFLNDHRRQKKLSMLYLYPLLLLPLFALIFNFSGNNESNNYVAYDFNRNLLESLPQNAYLLSTGKDNLTFPLYYLQKVEKIRTDVDLEIYYGKDPVNENFLKQKLQGKNQPVIFIDLLPPKYLDMDLLPYNFVFAYGTTRSPSQNEVYGKDPFSIRGIRPKMDYFNNRLKGYYYLKQALRLATDPQKVEYWFNKVRSEIPENDQLNNFITDYLSGRDDTGMS